MLPARTISQSVDRPFAEAYAFAHRPENFPRWAAGLSNSLHRDGDDWIADTPAGPATVRFAPPNDYGVLDHAVEIPGQPTVHIPLRLIANEGGTEIVFTLFRQPGMDDAAWEEDAAAVTKDLAALKALLESGATT